VLDAGHRIEWGWPVALYLVTKGIAGGCAMLAPFAAAMGMSGFGLRYAPEVLALIFAAITCFLLVEDLARPMRFYRLLTRPNWKSWLVKGGIILSAFMAIEAVIILLHLLEFDSIAASLRWAGAVGGLATAGYTAFLFAQCKGRDLWESRLLLPHLIVQAAMCGAVALLIFATDSWALRIIAIAMAAGHGLLSVMEARRTHETDNAKQAAAFLIQQSFGPFRGLRDGLLICVVLGAVCAIFVPLLALIPVLFGLYMYEYAFIRAGQLPPLS